MGHGVWWLVVFGGGGSGGGWLVVVVVAMVVVVGGGGGGGGGGGRCEQHLRKGRGALRTKLLRGLALLLVELEVMECGEKSLHVSPVFEESELTIVLDIVLEYTPQYTNLYLELIQSLL